jgi:hypothetical protein
MNPVNTFTLHFFGKTILIQLSPNTIRVMKLVEQVRNAYKLLVRQPDGKRLLRRPRYRWEDNIRMDLREMGWEGVDWINDSEQGSTVCSCEHSNEPLGSIKGWGV